MKAFLKKNRKIVVAVILAITAGAASFNGRDVYEATDRAETVFENVIDE